MSVFLLDSREEIYEIHGSSLSFLFLSRVYLHGFLSFSVGLREWCWISDQGRVFIQNMYGFACFVSFQGRETAIFPDES